MRFAAAIAVAVALLLSGCAPTVSGDRKPHPSGPTYGRITFDGVSSSSQRDESLRAARKSISDLTSLWYEYEHAKPAFAPETPDDFAREATLKLVPVYEYRKVPQGASSIYDVTQPSASDYVLLSFLDGELVAGCDWIRPAPNTPERPGPWFSFYGLGSLEYAEAIERMGAQFPGKPVQVRIVGVPRGWWIVGRSAATEKAIFVAHQGAYDDDPRRGRVYSLGEVLAYGAPHAFGE